MSQRGVGAAALVAAVAGSVLAYSGLKGKGISDSVRALLAGNSPATAATTENIADSTAATNSGTAAADSGNAVVAYAQSKIGYPYIWDTPSSASDPNPTSFDCSGLTMCAYYQIGKKLDHYTGTQYTQLDHRPFAQAQPGDLVFYADPIIYHVAIWIGGGQVIEAPEPGVPVRYRNVKSGDRDLMANVGIMP